MAMGLPVVGTTNGGTPELIEDGVSGFIVPERDVNALVDRLTFLLDHSEQWPAFGHKGADHVRKHYDINPLNDKLLSMYQSL
jgi:colanic acid/amylovoran biosynthesis glycosyltransferase